MNQYKYLTQEQRYYIYQCLKQGMTCSFVADNIGVNKSTISRELSYNTGKRSYRYKQAQALACNRQSVPKYQKWNDSIQKIVNSKLHLQWSLEQISRHLKINKNINISYEHIYQYILQNKKKVATYGHTCAVLTKNIKSVMEKPIDERLSQIEL